MRRFLVLLLIGAAAAFGIWFAMRGARRRRRARNVTALLPRDTIAFVHLPDFNRTREQWHETELYKLWREPAMQEFLQKPLGRAPQTAHRAAKDQRARRRCRCATRSSPSPAIENDQPKMVGGFRFKGEREDAEKVIGYWRAEAQENAPTRSARRSTTSGIASR